MNASPEMKKNNKFEIQKIYIENEKTELIIKFLEQLTIDSNRVELGKGANGAVYAFGDNRFGDFCLKKVHKSPLMKVLTIEEEHEYQEEVYKLGITTPRTLMTVLNHETREEFFIMERIDGYSIFDTLSDKTLLPEVFNYGQFFKKLSDQINKLHENRIHHRDLHAGNVMIDNDGNPVIIDFGSAGKQYISDEDIYLFECRKLVDPIKGIYQTVEQKVNSDEENIKVLKEKMSHLR